MTRRCRQGQVRDPEFRIATHHRPDVGIAHPFPGVGTPGVVAELSGLGHGLEGPELAAGVHVESAHVAERDIAAPVGPVAADVGHVGGLVAHQQRVPANGWCVAPRCAPAGNRSPQSLRHVHAPSARPLGLAEAVDRLPRTGRQRVEPAIACEQKDSPAVHLGAAMVGQPAGREAEHGRSRAVARAGIEGPQRLAGERVDRGNAGERRTDEQLAFRHQRRHLEAVRHLAAPRPAIARPRNVRVTVVVERLPRPGDAQVGRVRRRDVGERRVLVGPESAAVGRPVAVCRRVVEGAIRICRERLQRRDRPASRRRCNDRGDRCRRLRLALGKPSDVDDVGAPSFALVDQPLAALVVSLAAADGEVTEGTVRRTEAKRGRQVLGVRPGRRGCARQAHGEQPPTTHTGRCVLVLARCPCRGSRTDRARRLWRPTRSRIRGRRRAVRARRPGSANPRRSAPENRGG